jgi:hypothetical protein
MGEERRVHDRPAINFEGRGFVGRNLRRIVALVDTRVSSMIHHGLKAFADRRGTFALIDGYR